MCGANTGWPRLSSKKLVRRYSAPPLVACTSAPSSPIATVLSNSTGTSAVATLRAFSRDSARSAA